MVKDKLLTAAEAKLLDGQPAEKVMEYLSKAERQMGDDQVKALVKALNKKGIIGTTFQVIKIGTYSVIGVTAGTGIYVGAKYYNDINQYIEMHGGKVQALKDAFMGSEGRFRIEDNPDGTQNVYCVNDDKTEKKLVSNKSKAEVAELTKKIGANDKGWFSGLATQFKEHPYIMGIAGLLITMGMGGIVGDLVGFVSPTVGKFLNKFGENKLTAGIGALMIAASAATIIGGKFGLDPEAMIAKLQGKMAPEAQYTGKENAQNSQTTVKQVEANMDAVISKATETEQSKAMAQATQVVSPVTLGPFGPTGPGITRTGV